MSGQHEHTDDHLPCARARFAVRLDSLGEVGRWLRDECGRCGESGVWLDAFEMAVIEASSNAIRHVLSGPPHVGTLPNASLTLALTLRCCCGSVSVDLFDAGRPVPAGVFECSHELPMFDPDDIASLPEVGMGLGIIYASVDIIKYHRRLGINRLRLVKHRS
jgi:anti-sigma regulatory factor (Ser/Thr protein kinase)